jgi:hypothetical protein
VDFPFEVGNPSMKSKSPSWMLPWNFPMISSMREEFLAKYIVFEEQNIILQLPWAYYFFFLY